MEIVGTWVLWKWIKLQIAEHQTDDVGADMANPTLRVLTVLASKLRDEIVGRLSELGQEKIGRLNFFFAVQKLDHFHEEAKEYSRLVDRKRFTEKRNYDISHQELPEQWEDHRHVPVSYGAITKAIAVAMRLMKKVDLS